jgi:hypothetical protein
VESTLKQISKKYSEEPWNVKWDDPDSEQRWIVQLYSDEVFERLEKHELQREAEVDSRTAESLYRQDKYRRSSSRVSSDPKSQERAEYLNIP